MTAAPTALGLYRLATGLIEPFAPALLNARARRGKEDPGRIGERLGRPGRARPPGPLVWIHGASVGESLSHLPLTNRFTETRPDLNLLVTSGTRTSAALLARRLPERAIHQYPPIDAPRAVARFIDHWRPDLGVFVESELWPNLLTAAAARGTRLALVGARISEDSARRWARAPASAHRLLSLFATIWAHDFETRDWIEGRSVEVAGRFDLKRAADPLPYALDALQAMQSQIASRPVVLAASTHSGEETLIADAVSSLPDPPLLIVVPRHPERGPDVARQLEARGMAVALRSREEPVAGGTGAYVADTLGELGLFYRLAPLVVMGGAFREGLLGHNPLEPARLGAAVITGPHVGAFAEAYADLAAARAALIARDAAELTSALGPLLAEPALAQAMGERARAACTRGREGFELLWRDLEALAPEPGVRP